MKPGLKLKPCLLILGADYAQGTACHAHYVLECTPLIIQHMFEEVAMEGGKRCFYDLTFWLNAINFAEARSKEVTEKRFIAVQKRI